MKRGELMEVYIAKSLPTEQLKRRRKKDIIHYVPYGKVVTICGLDLRQSNHLTVPLKGTLAEVNCKKCLHQITIREKYRESVNQK